MSEHEQAGFRLEQRVKELELELKRSEERCAQLERERQELLRRIRGAIELLSGTTAPQTSEVGMPAMEIAKKLGGASARLYEILLKHTDGLTKKQLALLAGYKPTSGWLREIIAKLKTMGLVRLEGKTLKVVRW